MTILVLIGTVFVIICEMFHGRISLNSVLVLLLVNFVSGFRLKLMHIYPSSKVLGQPHSSSWFSAARAAAIAQRNFVCMNRINLLNLKYSSDRVVIAAKGS